MAVDEIRVNRARINACEHRIRVRITTTIECSELTDLGNRIALDDAKERRRRRVVSATASDVQRSNKQRSQRDTMRFTDRQPTDCDVCSVARPRQPPRNAATARPTAPACVRSCALFDVVKRDGHTAIGFVALLWQRSTAQAPHSSTAQSPALRRPPEHPVANSKRAVNRQMIRENAWRVTQSDCSANDVGATCLRAELRADCASEPATVAACSNDA